MDHARGGGWGGNRRGAGKHLAADRTRPGGDSRFGRWHHPEQPAYRGELRPARVALASSGVHQRASRLAGAAPGATPRRSVELRTGVPSRGRAGRRQAAADRGVQQPAGVRWVRPDRRADNSRRAAPASVAPCAPAEPAPHRHDRRRRGPGVHLRRPQHDDPAAPHCHAEARADSRRHRGDAHDAQRSPAHDHPVGRANRHRQQHPAIHVRQRVAAVVATGRQRNRSLAARHHPGRLHVRRAACRTAGPVVDPARSSGLAGEGPYHRQVFRWIAHRLQTRQSRPGHRRDRCDRPGDPAGREQARARHA